MEEQLKEMDLNQLEILMKSVVLSCTHDLTIENLNRDFKKEIGYSIPFKMFGFISLESLISSLDRSFWLSKRDGETYVKTISSRKTRHIEFMISAQNRKMPRKPRGGFRTRDNFFNKMKKDFNHQKQVQFEDNSPQPKMNSNSVLKSEGKISYSNPILQNFQQVEEKQTTFAATSQINCGYPKNYSDAQKYNQNKSNESTENSNITDGNCTKYTDFRYSQTHKRENTTINSKIFTRRDISKFTTENHSVTDEGCGEPNNFLYSKTYNDVESIKFDPKVSSRTDLNDLKYLDKRKAPEKSVLLELPLNERITVFREDIPVFVPDFPKNTALPGDKIPSAIHLSSITIGAQFCLYISEVHSPYKFWFHLEDSCDELDELMYEIELFNKNIGDSNEYNMHITNMKRRQLCMGLFNNYWHRAQILQLPVNNSVKVYFIDYGTVDYIATSAVRYIPKDFVQIPAQAYRGCLSFLKPANIKWDRDCTYFLLNMIYEKRLWAKLEHYDEIDEIYHITLIDTNNEIDININKLLIIKRHANLLHDIHRVKTHFQYVYPTFEMLENGEYPSFEEIGKLLAKGYDYETEEYKTLKSVNSEKLYGCSTLEYWNFIKNFKSNV